MTNKEAPCIFFKVDSLIQLNPKFVTENRNKIIYRLKFEICCIFVYGMVRMDNLSIKPWTNIVWSSTVQISLIKKQFIV